MSRRHFLGFISLSACFGGASVGCGGGGDEIPLAKVPIAPASFSNLNTKRPKRDSGISPDVMPPPPPR